jgi:hypothetical protein
VELRKANIGPEHPDTLNSMEGLAVSLTKLGRNEEALKVHQTTLVLRQNELGLDHRRTLCSMEDHAETLNKLGKTEEARKLHEKTFEIRKQKLGPEHPSTLRSMYGGAVGGLGGEKKASSGNIGNSKASARVGASRYITKCESGCVIRRRDGRAQAGPGHFRSKPGGG